MASPDDSNAPTPQRLLDVLAAAFAAAGLPHVLIGGQAVNLLPVVPRVTLDFDFTVRAVPAGIAQVRDYLTERGFEVVHEQALDPAHGIDFVRLKHTATGLGVDLEAASTEFEESALARARLMQPDQPVPSATPEDLVVYKLIANRSKDLADLLAILKLPDLDIDYIRRWAEIWGLEERLEGLLRWLDNDRPAPPP